ncbi:MAG TPA: cytochrome P450 [Ktedonobacterales bacterium]
MTNKREQRYPLGSQVQLADLSRNPYPILKELQAHEPLSWIPEQRLWFVTRRADMLAMLLDSASFTVVSPHSLLADTFGPTMLSTDGESQRKLRRPFNAPFAPNYVQAHMTEAIAAQANCLIDQFIGEKQVDLKTAFADHLALWTVTSMLGLPIHDFPTFRGWFTDIAHALGNFINDPAIRQRGQQAAAAFGDYALPHLERMRRSPDGSVLCAVLQASEPLTEEELLSAARVIIFGGLETTAAMFANTVWALLTHPEQFAAVRANPALLTQALEESLRWEPPVQTCTRHVARPAMIQGVELEPGETVQCLVGAANRDPAHFTNPDLYDIARQNARDHLSFAIGRHFCLGAALARLEGEIGLRILFDRLPDLRLAPERPSAPEGHEFRSPPTLYALWG